MSRPLLIGQRLNASGSRRIAQALGRRDAVTVADTALRQVAAGADWLDLCAAGAKDEPGGLQWLVETVQEAADVPLSLDTHNPDALRRVLPLCRRPPLLNSLSLTQFEAAWAFLRDWSHCPIVALCLGEQGGDTAILERLEIAARLADRLHASGFAPESILFDPLTLPARNGRVAQNVTLQTMTALRVRFPASRILCAVGNYGYGLTTPMRPLAERWYAKAALQAGADALLCDPITLRLPSLHFLSGFASDVIGEDVGNVGERE